MRLSFVEILTTLFLLSTAGLPATDAFAVEGNPCLTCHAEFEKPAASVHKALASGCQTCHVMVKGRKHPEQKDSIELVRQVPQLCYDCHERAQFRGKSVHPPVVIATCTACHDPHRSNFKVLLAKAIPGLCYECHDKSKFEGKSVHQPVGEGLCTSCHKPHASHFSNMLVSDPPELCYRCHDKNQFTKKYVHVVAAIPNGCLLCHDAHADNNQHLLLQPTIFDLCTSCHSEQRNGMHIIGMANLGFGNSVHPVKGMPDPSDPSKQFTCISCHNPHSSEFRKLVLQKKICKRCHKIDY